MDTQSPAIETLEQNETFGKFQIEPLQRGYGATLANPLRRVLLSSLQGAAITAIRIEGVLHEFATIPGLREDTTELLLNLKALAIKLNGEPPLTLSDEPPSWVLRIDKRGEGDISGADIECPPDIEIVNPELHIASLADDSAYLRMELIVEIGQGYVVPEKHERHKGQIGLIPVGSAFSPVRRVNFSLDPTRVGSKSDLERLILEVETNGALSPAEALGQAARVLEQSFRLFGDVSSEHVERQVEIDQDAVSARAAGQSAPDVRIEELDFSVRTYNCLKKANIQTVADLVRSSVDELMNIRNFGRKSLVEVQEKLGGYGYSLTGFSNDLVGDD